jgi:hypothetical protein
MEGSRSWLSNYRLSFKISKFKPWFSVNGINILRIFVVGIWRRIFGTKFWLL